MRRLRVAAPTAAALCLLSLVFAPAASADPGHGRAVGHRVDRVCDKPAPGEAACDSYRHDAVDAYGAVVPNATTVPAGALTPTDIQSAYNLPAAKTTTPNGPWVAIVDAYDDPNAEKDLGVYRKQFGLPACTTANGCFKKVNQNGSTRGLPQRNASWSQEISLDLDMVSAACPNCRILLVEATSASFANLATAVNSAYRLGAVAISNSYGGSDSSQMSAYNHPGVAITASTGDSGYGVQAPASFNTVVAVGGTSLTRNGSARGWAETAWSGAGSGCSSLNTKPSWQDATVTGCTGRASADVSAVADPKTGVAVYDSYAYGGAYGWLQFGGTSASSPIIASVFALSGNTAGYPAKLLYGAPSGLFDVTSGSNGACAATSPQWCAARAGWDGPTGLGTPNGTSAF